MTRFLSALLLGILLADAASACPMCKDSEPGVGSTANELKPARETALMGVGLVGTLGLIGWKLAAGARDRMGRR
jgi:hypothetical protein